MSDSGSVPLPPEKTQGPLNGGVSNGGVSRSGLVLPFLSFLGLSRFFRDFPDLLGHGPGIFPICPFPLSRPIRARTRNSPERVRDTIWTFPEKSGKHPGLEPPRFSFSQKTFAFLALLLHLVWGGVGRETKYLPKQYGKEAPENMLIEFS